MNQQVVPGVRGEFQEIVATLMRTLLEEHPTLLGERQVADLTDAEYCKDVLGLSLSNFALLRYRDQGRMIRRRARYWKHVYAGEFYVCSQWWKDHHRDNARALSRFVSKLARRRPEHPGARTLLRYVEAFGRYAESSEVSNGMAMQENAVVPYRDFRDAGGGRADSAEASAKQQPQARRTRKPVADWPVWPTPSDGELLELARAMTPFVRYLDPGIVYAVIEDNRRMRADWSSRLQALGIDPAIYLWEGSPCAFPGVRWYAGSTENAVFRKRASADEFPEQCLALDDNDYPKHLWAFAFTGKPFRKRGPNGYQLAHLFDHKEHRNRWREELDILPSAMEPSLPYGLFTSAANSAYVPGAFLRPTDFSRRLRSLIQRRALQLYGNICRIVPSPLAVKPCEDPNWALDNFQWSAPTGCMDSVPDFLKFRRERMGELFDKRHAALRTDGTR